MDSAWTSSILISSTTVRPLRPINRPWPLILKDANVWTDLGVMYRRSGDPKKAIEAFDRAISIDPHHEISRFNKGIVLFHDLKDEKGALDAWESLLAINPDAKSPAGQSVKQLIDHIKNNHQDQK